VFKEIRRARFYEKPSVRAAREKADAIRRARKLARKQAIREGLIAAPVRKPIAPGKGPRAPRSAAYAANIIAIYQAYRWNMYAVARANDPQSWHGPVDNAT
jgi:hypothetical protein